MEIVRSLENFSWNLNVIDHFIDRRTGLDCAAFELGGKSLQKWLRDTDIPIGFCTVLDITDRMLEIITELHSAGIAHRGAHLDNWLLGTPHDLSTLKLIDFGEASTHPDPTMFQDDVKRVRFEFLELAVLEFPDEEAEIFARERKLMLADEMYTIPAVSLLIAELRAEKCRSVSPDGVTDHIG